MSADILFAPIFNLTHQSVLLDQLMIFFAKDLIYVIFFLVIIYSLKPNKDNRKALLLSILSLGLSLILIEIIRLFFYLPRPTIIHGITTLIPSPQEPSFPSKHTADIFCLVWSYLIYKSKITLFLLTAGILIGFSRVFVGVHYPIDIIGGILVSGVSVYFIHHLHKLIQKYI